MLRQQEEGLVDPRPTRMRDDDPKIAERPADVVQKRGPSQLEARVDPGRAGLMDHHRDLQLLGLLVDRERQLGIVHEPVLVHRVELDAREPELHDRTLELLDGGLRAFVRRVHGAVSDQLRRFGSHARRDVVVAFLGVRRAFDIEDPVGVDRSDQPAVEPLGRDRQDDALVEPNVVAHRLLRSDHGPAGTRVATPLPLLLRRHPMRRQQPHRPIDAEGPLTPVLDGERGVLGERQDVAVGVDDHRAAAPSGAARPDRMSASTPAEASTRTNASVAFAWTSARSIVRILRSSITTSPSIRTVLTARPCAAKARCAYSWFRFPGTSGVNEGSSRSITIRSAFLPLASTPAPCPSAAEPLRVAMVSKSAAPSTFASIRTAR